MSLKPDPDQDPSLLLYGVPLLWIVLTSLKPSSLVFDKSACSCSLPLDAYAGALDSGSSPLSSVDPHRGRNHSRGLCSSRCLRRTVWRTRGWLVTVFAERVDRLPIFPQTATVIPLFSCSALECWIH